MADNQNEPKPLPSSVYVMIIEAYLFCGAVFGLVLFYQGTGVMSMIPFTLVVGLGASTLFMTFAVGMIQMGLVGMEERSFLHLKYAPGALVLGVVQACIHVTFSLLVTVCSLTILIWTSKHRLKEQFLVFWYASRIQEQSSEVSLKISIVIFLSLGVTILLIQWIIFAQTRSALGEIKKRRSHFSGLVQCIVILFVWAQYQLDEITNKVCGDGQSCTLIDAAVFNNQSGLLQNTAIFLSVLLLLDLFTAKAAAFFVTQPQDLWLIAFVSGRVVMLGGIAVIYLMFIEIPMPMLTNTNYILGGVLLASVSLEIALIFNFKKQNFETQKHEKGSKLKTSIDSDAKRFFNQPLQVGTRQAHNRLFFRKDGVSRRKTEEKSA